jgi:hypothetical protein
VSRRSKLEIASLAVAAVVLGLSIAQSVRQGSLEPIWMIGWLPAVIAGGFYRPSKATRCSLRLRR